MVTSRERFLEALAGGCPDRPPVWMMRQAGRYLPEYRALRQRHSFLEMVQTPELACEVTVQPLRRFPLDAAIVFSDILIVPEALGQPYHFRDGGGIGMAHRLDSAAAMAALRPAKAVTEALDYLPQALRLVRQEIGPGRALLGFAGCPWTLACYMAEGGSPPPGGSFSGIHRLRASNPAAFGRLLEHLSEAVIELCRMQFAAGADAVQLFDSHGADCDPADYESCSLRWNREIIAALRDVGPVIFFAKGVAQHREALAGLGASALSLDPGVNLAAFRAALGAAAGRPLPLQGNLEPTLLEGPPEPVVAATRNLLDSLGGRGHILNLGHGITPQARLDSVEAFLEIATTWRAKSA